MDIAARPKRKYRELIPQLRGAGGRRGRGKKAQGYPDVVPSGAALQVELRPAADGLTLTVRGRPFGFMELDRLSAALTKAREVEEKS
jgi:hypothetical protein